MIDKSELKFGLVSQGDFGKFVKLVVNIKDSEAIQYAVYPIFTHLWVYGCWLRKNLIGVTQMMPSVISDTAFIIDTTVSQQYRNKGVGTRLILERERFLIGQGRTNVVSTIAPWNGPSLNCIITKNSARGVRYHLGNKALGEDKVEIIKDLTSTKIIGHEAANMKTFKVHSRKRYLASRQRQDIVELMNAEGYELARVEKLDKSRNDSCILFLGLPDGG